jgi:proteic killer suppression protein
MIQSFGNKDTESIWKQHFVKKIPRDVQRVGLRKLIILHRAQDLNDLRVPPGNRLEELSGNRKGQHSIRINDQWRICFYWKEGSPSDVEIVDYH